MNAAIAVKIEGTLRCSNPFIKSLNEVEEERMIIEIILMYDLTTTFQSTNRPLRDIFRPTRLYPPPTASVFKKGIKIATIRTKGKTTRDLLKTCPKGNRESKSKKSNMPR
jgi:hypothetical protein